MGNGEWEATASVLIEHGADLTKALPNIIDHKNATDYADLVNQMIRKSSQEARNAALITAIRNIPNPPCYPPERLSSARCVPTHNPKILDIPLHKIKTELWK